jgi:hypothetical protein
MNRQSAGRSFRFDLGDPKVRFTFDPLTRAASLWCTARGLPLTVRFVQAST